MSVSALCIIYRLRCLPCHSCLQLTGGYLFPQHLRQTADADIKTVRRLSNREMQNAYKTLKLILALEGIELHEFSREPSIIALAYGEPVDRYYIKATCGTIRGNTNLDISSGNAPGSFPKNVAWRDIPSIIKGGPALRVRCQPLAAAAAEKLLAVLMQPTTDTRVKHFADIANSDLWEGIDCRQVAEELTRVCKNRGIPMSVCAERSPALAWTAVSAREAEWAKHMAAGKTELTFDQAHEDIVATWSEVHRELRAQVIRDYRNPSIQPTLADRITSRTFQYKYEYKPTIDE